MKSSLEHLVDGHQVLAIVCNQWGDTGKGKFVDLFADWADIIARGNGGANAGHTIQLNGKQYVVHLLPSGILHEDKINLLGRGVAFDPLIFQEELKMLDEHHLSYDNLYVSAYAPVILPYHRLYDSASALSKGIGTTGKGIGPLYSGYVAREAIFVQDLLNKDVLAQKINQLHEKMFPFFDQFGKSAMQVLLKKQFANLSWFHETKYLDRDAMIEAYTAMGKELKHMVIDEQELLKKALSKGKHLLLEGAQGLLLSIDYGTYPYVTSSDASFRGLAKGVGLKENDVDSVFGILKFPYMTRVGSGPFPTELGGRESEKYCAEHHTKEEELPFALTFFHQGIDGDAFALGKYLRIQGDEYGRTTKRPRRTGWFDLVAARYAATINGPDVILTKLDVVQNVPEIKIATAYRYIGDTSFFYGGREIKPGDVIDFFPARSPELLYHLQPIYEHFQGFHNSLRIDTYEDLPQTLQTMIAYLEKRAGVRVRMISVGPDRNKTIIK